MWVAVNKSWREWEMNGRVKQGKSKWAAQHHSLAENQGKFDVSQSSLICILAPNLFSTVWGCLSSFFCVCCWSGSVGPQCLGFSLGLSPVQVPVWAFACSPASCGWVGRQESYDAGLVTQFLDFVPALWNIQSLASQLVPVGHFVGPIVFELISLCALWTRIRIQPLFDVDFVLGLSQCIAQIVLAIQ